MNPDRDNVTRLLFHLPLSSQPIKRQSLRTPAEVCYYTTLWQGFPGLPRRFGKVPLAFPRRFGKVPLAFHDVSARFPGLPRRFGYVPWPSTTFRLGSPGLPRRFGKVPLAFHDVSTRFPWPSTTFRLGSPGLHQRCGKTNFSWCTQ